MLSASYGPEFKNTAFTMYQYFNSLYIIGGANGDWDFRISDLVKNPGGTDI